MFPEVLAHIPLPVHALGSSPHTFLPPLWHYPRYKWPQPRRNNTPVWGGSSAICWSLALTTLMIVESSFRCPSISKSISASVVCVFRISRIPFALAGNSANVLVPIGSILFTIAEVCMYYICQQGFALPTYVFEIVPYKRGYRIILALKSAIRGQASGSNRFKSAILDKKWRELPGACACTNRCNNKDH